MQARAERERDSAKPQKMRAAINKMSVQKVAERVLLPVVPMVIITLAAEIVVRAGLVQSFLVPTPSSVVVVLFSDWRILLGATWSTASAALIGFLMSAVVGFVVAIVLSSSGWVQRALYPYAVFFQTVPIVAIAPLIVIWFRVERTPEISAFIVSLFPVIANTLTGLLSTDPALRDLFRLYKTKPIPTLIKLRLPFALPHIFTGLRIAAGLAIIGAIVGEFVTGGGVGDFIQTSRQMIRVDRVFAGLLMATLMGIVLFVTINFASRLALRRWHASEGAD